MINVTSMKDELSKQISFKLVEEFFDPVCYDDKDNIRTIIVIFLFFHRRTPSQI